MDSTRNNKYETRQLYLGGRSQNETPVRNQWHEGYRESQENRTVNPDWELTRYTPLRGYIPLEHVSRVTPPSSCTDRNLGITLSHGYMSPEHASQISPLSSSSSVEFTFGTTSSDDYMSLEPQIQPPPSSSSERTLEMIPSHGYMPLEHASQIPTLSSSSTEQSPGVTPSHGYMHLEMKHVSQLPSSSSIEQNHMGYMPFEMQHLSQLSPSRSSSSVEQNHAMRPSHGYMPLKHLSQVTLPSSSTEQTLGMTSSHGYMPLEHVPKISQLSSSSEQTLGITPGYMPLEMKHASQLSPPPSSSSSTEQTLGMRNVSQLPPPPPPPFLQPVQQSNVSKYSYNEVDHYVENDRPMMSESSAAVREPKCVKQPVKAPNSAPAFYTGMSTLTKNVNERKKNTMENINESENKTNPIKKIIHLTNCVLYPPNPNAPRPITREKPLGCKTVFVGGLPEKATEEIVKEIFERCGVIENIRMSNNRFCHIRFSNEMHVDSALFFLGYRVKIENKEEPSYTGRLYIDYAQARNDQHDYECKQRSVTPPVQSYYSEHEASLLVQKLRNGETFAEAAYVLITWLERGQCSKRNAGNFYSMIQCANYQVRRLEVDKVKYEEQLNNAKTSFKKNLEESIKQFTFIEKIYKAASLQKSWDHFTKAQRKNIEMWRKQTEELRSDHVEKVINEREDEEMELSEDENEDKKNGEISAQQKKQLEEENHKLHEEKDALRCEIETVKKEMVNMQFECEEAIKRKDAEISALRQALQNSQKALLNMSERFSTAEVKTGKLKESSVYVKRRRVDSEDNNEFAVDSSADNEQAHNVNDLTITSSADNVQTHDGENDFPVNSSAGNVQTHDDDNDLTISSSADNVQTCGGSDNLTIHSSTDNVQTHNNDNDLTIGSSADNVQTHHGDNSLTLGMQTHDGDNNLARFIS